MAVTSILARHSTFSLTPATEARPSPHERVFAALHETALAARTAELETLAGLTVDRVREVLRADGTAVHWWDETTLSLDTLARSCAGDGCCVARIGRGADIEGMALEAAEVMRVNDYATWPGAVAWRRESVGSALAIALRSSGRAVGVLSVHSRTPGRFGEDAPRLLTLFSGELGSAIARRRQRVEFERLALHDTLTGLANRVLFYERLEQAIALSRRQGQTFAVLMIDLDNFKDVNDTFGHDVGDALLRQVASCLGREVRQSDTVARLGGDEFAIVLLGADDVGAAQAARKVLGSLERSFKVEGQHLKSEASIGVAIFPQHGDDPRSLLRRADVAMYVAKARRAGYSVYTAEHDEHTPRRLQLVSELHRALERGELVMHYQPIVAAAGTAFVRAEALARWEHPERGIVPPGEFVPLLERTGLIRPFSEWSIAQAIRQQAAWRKEGRRIPVAVNLSMHGLLDPHLAAFVGGLLAEHGVEGGDLMVEITESVMMADPERTIATLRQLRDMKVRISIDDFGTGYSSLAYLQRLPADELKVDRSFVAQLGGSAEHASIVKATVELGHAFGLEVVAEGVEDPATAELLRGLGVDLLQGHLISRAMPAAALPGWVDDAAQGRAGTRRAA